MSVEFEVVLVPTPVYRQYARSELVQTIWWLGTLAADTRAAGLAPTVADIERYCRSVFHPPDAKVQCRRMALLIEQGALPVGRLRLGSEWQHLRALFEGEMDADRRRLLLAAFHGAKKNPIPIESTHGECGILETKELAAVAQGLASLDLSRLQTLAAAAAGLTDGGPSAVDAARGPMSRSHPWLEPR